MFGLLQSSESLFLLKIKPNSKNRQNYKWINAMIHLYIATCLRPIYCKWHRKLKSTFTSLCNVQSTLYHNWIWKCSKWFHCQKHWVCLKMGYSWQTIYSKQLHQISQEGLEPGIRKREAAHFCCQHLNTKSVVKKKQSKYSAYTQCVRDLTEH